MRILLALVLTATVANAEPTDDAKALAAKAGANERNGDWDKAQELNAQLAAIKGYETQGLYGEAWDAWQRGAMTDAATFAQKAGAIAGPYQLRAQILHGDARYRMAEYTRAKDIYGSIKASGDDAAILARKIKSCDDKLRSTSAGK